MPMYEFEGKRPVVAPSAFVHPEATLIGEVVIEEGCYVGPGARIRGDWCGIFVGKGSNIQENVVIHSKPDVPVVLGPSSHVGHGSILHGATLKEHVWVGMGAIVMDGAVIEEGCLIAAGCVVKEGTHVPPGKLVAGVPGRIIGDVSEELRRRMDWGTELYQGLPPRCHEGLRRID